MIVSAVTVAFVPGRGGYAVGWGTLALINAALAQDRRRSGLAWFLLSLLIGPLATLLLVLLPRLQSGDGGTAA